MNKTTERLSIASGGVAGGLLLGWAFFHGDATPPPSTASQGITARVETRPMVQPRHQTEPIAGSVQEAPPVAPQAPAVRSGDDDVAALKAQVAQLQAQVELEQKMRRNVEGEQVPVPAGLPARFRDEKQLLTAFNAALTQAGFQSAQVTSIDCSEHPCIVFGTGFGARSDMEKLQAAPAMSAYAKDSFGTFGFQRGKDEASRFFGVAVMPADGESPEEVQKRMAWRVKQMEEASRPPLKPR